MKQYRPLIQDVLADAEEAGYERSPEGAESHYQSTKEKAQLLDSFLTEQAARLFANVFGILRNPLGIATVLGVAALIAVYLLRRNKQVLEILTNSAGKAQQLRERLWIEYIQDQQTAADEKLGELDGINEMGQIYWSDAFGVDTTAGLAELFRNGVPVRRNGETRHVGGVENLSAQTIDSDWIEAVCRKNRLPAPEIALSHGKTALQRMISKYGMGHVYEDTYVQVRELIEELDDSNDLAQYAGTSARSTDTEPTGGAAAGGDD